MHNQRSRTLEWAFITLAYFLGLCESGCRSSQNQFQETVFVERYGYEQPRQIIQYESNCENVELPIHFQVQDYEDYRYCTDPEYICRQNLRITSSNISIVPSSSFSDFYEMTKLYLENQHVTTLIPGAFNGLQSLRGIYLSRNNLTQINVGIFNALLNLETLDLSRNEINFLEHYCFTGMTKLKILNLSTNALTTFDNFILDNSLMKLQYFDLSFNNISELDSTVKLPEIENMDLSSNMLVEFDFCTAKLGTLNVSNNGIRSFRDTVCSNITSKLINLDVSFNEISVLDSDFFSISTDLQSINMHHNNISIIPNDLLMNLNNLHSLNISYNNILSIPNGLFSHSHNLNSLNISHNNIEDFDHGTFDSLDKLEILDISHNRLAGIKRYFHWLQNLIELHIDDNKITFLNSHQLVADSPGLRNLSFLNNNFICENLIEIIHYAQIRRVQIEYGNAKNVSNIHGISCIDNENIQSTPTGILDNINSKFESIIMNKLEQMSDKKFKESAMYEYFDSDFKNSNFYKYMENLQRLNAIRFNETRIIDYFNEDFENTKFFKYLESLKNAENASIEFNRSVTNYFNSDFKNSNFVKYLDELKDANDLFNKEFSKTAMFKFFNDEFDITKLYKYLKSLQMFSQTFSSSISQNISGFRSPENIPNNNKISSSMIILLMIVLSCNLLYITYLIRNKIININSAKIEQVELIDA